MIRYTEHYKNTETGMIAFKRLVVRKMEDGLFYVVRESDYGNGSGVTVTKMPNIKPYKTESGAEKALEKWQPAKFYESKYEALVRLGYI